MSRCLAWTDSAWSDYLYWQGQDRKTIKRINRLIRNTMQTPFKGIGNPEPLKANLSGFWSRRIDDTHRFVYGVSETHVTVIACRYYYST
ncbi:MAG: Txe/YoeB family addiction module toxin [Candidatus Aegiribacteria sp.]|nr:Txe/YoeB family addiction module toxin [Candidatus Aegiribacteria sp.]